MPILGGYTAIYRVAITKSTGCIDWPEVEITSRFSRITHKQWKLKLKIQMQWQGPHFATFCPCFRRGKLVPAKAGMGTTKDVQISTTASAQFSDNFIDMIPPGEFEITIDCEQQAFT